MSSFATSLPATSCCRPSTSRRRRWARCSTSDWALAPAPTYLAEAARHKLREKFLEAGAGITGVNFAIAETGGFVVCTNEGNADLGTSLPPLHIACMGIEKLVPRLADLGVFLRLLARSATGQ
ncbi:MAG TPA: LUD domain-containing protein, partial [Lacipirellulaceae bacterium]|nr:LUD domain-containing protein [Lacipirellulaceae bacterium]